MVSFGRNMVLINVRPRSFSTIPSGHLRYDQDEYVNTEEMTRNQHQKILKNKKPDYLYGVNTVLASLSANRRNFTRLFLNLDQRGLSPKSSPKIEQIFKMSSHYGIKIKYVTKK